MHPRKTQTALERRYSYYIGHTNYSSLHIRQCYILCSNYFSIAMAGPHVWSKYAPVADGKRQSPIDITNEDCAFDESLQQRPLEYKYDANKATSLVNTGCSAQVKYVSDGSSKYKRDVIVLATCICNIYNNDVSGNWLCNLCGLRTPRILWSFNFVTFSKLNSPCSDG